MYYGDTFAKRLECLMTQKDFPVIPKTETLRQLAEKKQRLGHLSGADIAKIAQVSTASANYWLANKTFPQMECLKLLSDAFGVSVEWLLAQTDSRNLEFKTGYGAFEELGFSAKAYENLKRLKDQGRDMKELMDGINQLLEYDTQPHSDLSDEIEEYKKQAAIEDTEDEKEYLLGAADKLDKYVAEIRLPALEYLNDFFDLYPNGVYTHVPLRKVMKLGIIDEDFVDAAQAAIDAAKTMHSSQSSDEEWLVDEYTRAKIQKFSEMQRSLFSTISPAQNDGAALFAFENVLKEIKKKLIIKKVEEKSKGTKYFDKEYLPTFSGATYGYHQSQEYALELLCDFYALDVDTSKMREKQ